MNCEKFGNALYTFKVLFAAAITKGRHFGDCKRSVLQGLKGPRECSPCDVEDTRVWMRCDITHCTH